MLHNKYTHIRLFIRKLYSNKITALRRELPPFVREKNEVMMYVTGVANGGYLDSVNDAGEKVDTFIPAHRIQSIELINESLE